MPSAAKTCLNGHTSTVPIAKLTCHCGADYPQYVNLVKPGWMPTTVRCANPQCKVSFVKDWPNHKYHDSECRYDHYHARTFKQPYPGLTPTTVGDIGEFRVTIDLLAKGYDVFKSMSGNGWADLIVAVERKLSSVGVRTGYRTITGGIWYSKQNLETDIVAVVLPDEIIYLPSF